MSQRQVIRVWLICTSHYEGQVLALLSKCMNNDYPNGLAWAFIEMAKKVNKPSDASVAIELEVELD